MSNVRSVPVAHAPQVRAEMTALAVVLILFGVLAWIIGGRYTILGWTEWLTRFSHWIGLDVDLPAPRGWPLIVLIVVSGLLYSLVELLIWRASARRLPLFWIGWLPIVGTDVGSTFFGMQAVKAADPLILQQVAAVWPLALFVAVVLTFLPEWAIVGGCKLFRR